MKIKDKINKFEIRKVDDIDNNVSLLGKVQINHNYKKLAKKLKKAEARRAESNLRIANMKQENKEEEASLLDTLKTQKTKTKIELQKAKGFVELKQAENKVKRVESIERTGRILKKFNYGLVITSCLTSMLGFGMLESGLDLFPLLNSIKHKQHLNCLAIGIIFLIVQFCVSFFVASGGNIKQFFNNWINKILLGLIGVVYAVSIYSNYGFWITLTSSVFVASFYSFIIDAFAIFTSYYSNKFVNLESKKIQEFLKEEEEENTEKTSEKIKKKNVGKNVATLDKQDVCDVNKNVEKDTKKRKRKSVGKNKITQEEFDKKVINFEEGKRLLPRQFELTHERDKFLKYCKNCPYVEKIGNNYYRKTEEKKIEVVR